MKTYTIEETKEMLKEDFEAFTLWMRGKEIPYGGFYWYDVDAFMRDKGMGEFLKLEEK